MPRDRREWARVALHFPVGLFVVAAICLPSLLGFSFLLTIGLITSGVLAGTGFLAYEIMQDWRKADQGYKDVLGYVAGIFAGIAGSFIIGI